MEKNEQGTSCEFKENLSILREIEFFSELPLEVLKVLAYLCKRETFKKGDFLFHQKDDDGQAVFIISGKARLVYPEEDRAPSLREFDEGDFLGSLALLGKAHRLFSLKALTDMTCLILSRDKFLKVAEQFPDIILKSLKSVVGRIHTWEEKFLSEVDESCQNCLGKTGVSLV